MGKQLDALAVSAFCESMAMMLDAGIQAEEAVALLQQGGNGGELEQALQQMEIAIEQGSHLHAAMEACGVFPAYAVQMTAAGEESGRLESVLQRLARYYAEQKTIQQKLKNAVTYPVSMLALTIALLTVMLLVVLPTFSSVYNTLTGSLTASSYGYIRWATVFCAVALVVMIALLVAMVGGLLLWNTGHRAQVEAVLRALPPCAAILHSLALFRFSAALATYLASGEMQDAAVQASLPMAGDAPTEAVLHRCLEQMEQGHSFAQAAYDQGLLEPVYGRMLLAGERGGSLESVLDRLTALLEQNYSHAVESLVAVVDPALSGVLMLTVGISLLSVMLPLVGMMNAIG